MKQKKHKNIVNLNNENIISILKHTIINYIIKKSQFRTKERHYQSKEENDEKVYKYDDFVKVKELKTTVGVYYNVEDGFLYILKKHTEDKLFNHELLFINKFPTNAHLFQNIMVKCN